MRALFPDLDPAQYQRHVLHGPDRIWPESNCYSDLWIEVLQAMGRAPEAAFGFTITQDFEGDQFTFAKPLLEDLEVLYGVVAQELAIYDDVATHVEMQLSMGRLSFVEVDSFFLPDTRGLSYQTNHGKTSIAINRLDRSGRRAEYFHGPGYHVLEGDDFEGVFNGYGDDAPPFLPYVEFVKFPTIAQPAPDPGLAAELLARHLRRRPIGNPIGRFQGLLPMQAEMVANREPGFFHLFAFNTLRQFGANFELLSSHLNWLTGRDDTPGFESCMVIARTAKAAQFQLARACARKRFDSLPGVLQPAVDAYDELVETLESRWGAGR